MVTIRKLINDVVGFKSIQEGKLPSEILRDSELYITFYTKNKTKYRINLNAKYDRLNKDDAFRKINIEIMDGICRLPEEMKRYNRNPFSVFSSKYDNVPERIINSMLVLNGEIDYERSIKKFIVMEKGVKRE